VTNKEIMSAPLITIHSTSPSSLTADMMLKNNVRHLLVIDDVNKPIGIITPLDLTRYQEYTTDKDKEAIEKVLESYMQSADAGSDAFTGV
jgi:signal-transduction protein with cAMP-binding, CBS, and nucleotidyltransferase domain